MGRCSESAGGGRDRRAPTLERAVGGLPAGVARPWLPRRGRGARARLGAARRRPPLALSWQLFFARTPESRAEVDLKLHFAPATLDAADPARGGRTRRALLKDEYLDCDAAAGQPRPGFLGQLAAVFAHGVSRKDAKAVRGARLPVLVVHGRNDLLAAPARGAALARRLGAAYVELEGAHFVTRERGPEVTALLRHAVAHGPAWAADPHRDLAPRASRTPEPGATCATPPRARSPRRRSSAPRRVPTKAPSFAFSGSTPPRASSPTSALEAPRTPPRPLSQCPLVGAGGIDSGSDDAFSFA